jgi:hypothetical protein
MLGLKTIKISRDDGIEAGWRLVATVEAEIGDSWQDLVIEFPRERVNTALRSALNQLVGESSTLAKLLVTESATEMK